MALPNPRTGFPFGRRFLGSARLGLLGWGRIIPGGLFATGMDGDLLTGLPTASAGKDQ